MKTKNSIAIGLSIFTLFILSGCVSKTINETTSNFQKYQYKNKKLELPISTQACVGDNCIASIQKSKQSIRPFEVIDTYPKIEQIVKNTSIQVGAFRRYAGAKIYARRYELLSNQYKTVIKKYIKNAKPLYRVRIEGFANEYEAKAFMSQYSLNGAFLVRR